MVSKIFYFHPYLGKIPVLTNIFQMGWNHQLVLIGKLDHINGKPMKTLRSAALQPFWIEEEKASKTWLLVYGFFVVASGGFFLQVTIMGADVTIVREPIKSSTKC